MRPLCVELDGTLVRADLSLESLLGAVKRAPWILLLIPFWLLRGRGVLKSELARRADIDTTVLPYDEAVLQLARSARAEGRVVWLVTSSHARYASGVAEHVALFDRVIATDESGNLSGRRKARRLDELIGIGGYDYLGRDQVPASRPAGLIQRWLRAIRIHQWAKNALIFVPLITAHQMLDPRAIGAAFAAFIAMGLVASATYIVNDLLDLDADRHHARKRNRPFASGSLSVASGLTASVLMLGAGIAIAAALPFGFRIALSFYLVTTLLYSLRLKRIASLDVMLLAGLYTLRVIAGAWATGVPLSFWLLAFSMFIFLCLAMVKRVAELIELQRRETLLGGVPTQILGREYSVQDIPILQVMGASSGYLAVLVLALYINSPDVAKLYRTPEILWLIAPLMLLWVTRLWVVTTRGYMHDDPIFFAIKDPETWVTAAVTGAILVAATRFTL